MLVYAPTHNQSIASFNENTDTESNSSQEHLGLPENVLKRFQEERRIGNLYDWQKRCLANEHLLGGHNFILALPTGAGKTLIAEVLILRETLVKHRNCILILPFVAIVQEKIASLLPFEASFGVFVEEYAASKGRLPPFKRRKGNSIYVCTIEKANILVNSLIETGRMDEIGLVIADEFHMLGEPGGRGSTLEQCLTKILCMGRSQVVGISATLSNLDELARFLRAQIFTTDFRPVKLQQRVKIGSFVYNLDDAGEFSATGVQLPENKLKKKDIDGIAQLLDSIVPKKSVIIFCPSKKNCENLCQTIASLFPSSILDYRLEERLAVLEQIREENDGRICPILQHSIRCGIAYHHSGLMQDERQHIEAAFKNGVICIICATSTLAAGVNLPARRVIIRSPYVGRAPLRKTQYLQMVGRAGRAGFDEKGDSIVILKEGAEKEMFLRMIQNPLEECRSGLAEEASLGSFCLDLIFLRISKNSYDLRYVISQTLYGIQSTADEHFFAKIDMIIDELLQSRMVERQILEDNVEELSATDEGAATFSANFRPNLAQEIKGELVDNLSRGIVLSSHFHLIYAIIPSDITINVDWNIFYTEFKCLSDSEKALLASLGIRERNIIQNITRCTGNQKSGKATQVYIAFMMRQIWNQKPLWQVSTYFGVERGWLQSALQATCTQAGAIVRFSEKISTLWPLKNLLPEMVRTLSMCKHQELMPLLSIDCVKWSRAKAFFSAGFKTVASIARANPANLIEALDGKLSAYHARRIINSAKTVIRDQIAEKAEELEQMGLTTSDIFEAQS